MKTAVIYARYSSDRQTEQSIEGQLRDCYEYAQRNDIVVVDKYIDRAMTGTNDNREDFQRMLKDSDKKAWDYVLVYKLDRFSRNKYEMAIHRKHLKDNGIRIISAKENIPETPEGVLLESLLEGMNQYYSEELSQKTKRGMRETRLKGNFIGGNINYGYSLKELTSDVNGKPVRIALKVIINEQEASVLYQIFTDYANGKRICEIVRELDEKGILNRGNPFSPNMIYAMLQQEKYTGIYRIHNEVYDKIYPPIIPKDLFQTVKTRIDANKYGKHVPGVDYMLKGRIYCGYCGKPLRSATGTSKDTTIWRYYKCSSIKKDTGCQNKAMKKEVLEQFIIDVLFKKISEPENIELIVKGILEKYKKKLADDTDLRYYEKELTNTNKALSNIIAAIEAGIYTETTKQRLQELEEKKHHLEENILIEKTHVKEALSEKEIIQRITSALKLKAKQAIEMLIQRIDVFRDVLKITLKYMDGSPTDMPPDKKSDNPDGNDSCRGFLIMSYDEQYEVYHARTYKYKGFREYHIIKSIRIEIYI